MSLTRPNIGCSSLRARSLCLCALVACALTVLAGSASLPVPAFAATASAAKKTAHAKSHKVKRHTRHTTRKPKKRKKRPSHGAKSEDRRPPASHTGTGSSTPAATAPSTSPTTPASQSLATPRLFAATSVWNTPLASDAPVDPSSSTRLSTLVADIRAKEVRGQVPWPGTGHTTFYTVGPNQPRVPVKLDTGSWGATLQVVLNKGVPIPDDAIPGEGTDAHLVIYQPSTDTMWEFWQAVRKGDGWHASWGGAMQQVSQNPGYYTNESWAGLPASNGWNWGATASSLPEVAGLITIDELRAGKIDHAIAVDVATACKIVFAFPAQLTDGQDPASSTCIPEGARLRLDPSLDLSKYKLTPTARAVAVAAQKYGMIVRDITWGTFQFDMETPQSKDPALSPYKRPDGVWGGQPGWVIFKNFPFESLQLMQMKTCTQAPCLAPPTIDASLAGRRVTRPTPKPKAKRCPATKRSPRASAKARAKRAACRKRVAKKHR
jgi:hypothetical protein